LKYTLYVGQRFVKLRELLLDPLRLLLADVINFVSGQLYRKPLEDYRAVQVNRVLVDDLLVIYLSSDIFLNALVADIISGGSVRALRRGRDTSRAAARASPRRSRFHLG